MSPILAAPILAAPILDRDAGMSRATRTTGSFLGSTPLFLLLP